MKENVNKNGRIKYLFLCIILGGILGLMLEFVRIFVSSGFTIEIIKNRFLISLVDDFIIGALFYGLSFYYIFKPYEGMKRESLFILAIFTVTFTIYLFAGYLFDIDVLKVIEFNADFYRFNFLGLILAFFTTAIIYYFFKIVIKHSKKPKHSGE